MSARRSLKLAMLAASALAVTAPVMAHAAPTVAAVEAPAAPAGHVDEPAARAPVPAKAVGLVAAAAGLAALLLKLIGAEKIRGVAAAAGPVAVKAAKAAAAAPAAAVRAVGRAASAPFRFALLFGGLGLFALTGVGLYDIEWIGGLLAGLALAAVALYGSMRARRFFAPRPARAVRRATER